MPNLQLSRRATETLVVTLLAAAVSGLAFVAYRYPHGYRSLAIPLGAVTTMYCVSAFAFRLGGLEQGIRSLNDRLRERASDPLSTVDHLITGLDHNRASMSRLAIICLLVLAYLALLWFLPTILGTQQLSHGSGGA